MERFDAVVIGAGPAGSTAAILLARRGWSVLLVEGKAFPRRKVCGEYLSATNWPLFRQLGLLELLLEQAGPAVSRTAIFCGKVSTEAALPCGTDDDPWGRALSREHLDVLLRNQAIAAGAQLIQPAHCESISRCGDDFECTLEEGSPSAIRRVCSRVVIAAHGSWDIGGLATQRQPLPPRPSDWLAFKAHFRNAELPLGLMPLLSFADGYGGMTHCDGGRVSLSCCVQRRRFQLLPRSPGESAGQAVLQHILESCPVLELVLRSARLDGPWLSAGPIQPGIRPRYRDGVFVVGNAAGEAHPVVAEGISMAMQSAWALCSRLTEVAPTTLAIAERDAIGRQYARDWRLAFEPRLRAAAAIAQIAKRPSLMRIAQPLVRAFPDLLTWGARLSGKSTVVVRTDASAAQALQ